MAKFYVESGEQWAVLQADHARGAALWMVHKATSPALPVSGEGENETPAPVSMQLGEFVSVSQRGFGRSDAKRFETAELVEEWQQLMVALERLEGACVMDFGM